MEHYYMGASILGVLHSTEVLVEYMVEMADWSAGNGTKVQKTKEEVYTRRDEQVVLKREWMCSG